MSLRPYSKYKPTGVEWLGEVPAHWEVVPLKFIATVRPSSVDRKSAESETRVRFLGTDTVYSVDEIRDDIELELATASPAEMATFLLQEGDVILTKDSVVPTRIADVSIVTEPLNEVICGYHLALVRLQNNTTHKRFLFYYLGCEKVNHYLLSEARGTTIIGIGGSTIASVYVLCPPHAETYSIAGFLDRETARIDALIEKKQRQIELLQEKRAALISHAVTRGLNPHAPMKDSGVEWLGEVPAHWAVRRVKLLAARIGSGKTPRGGAEIYVDAGVMLLRSQNIHFDGLELDDVVFIEPEIDAEMASTRVISRDVLLNITGASLGRCCIVPENMGPANVNQHVCIIRARPGVVDPQYLGAAMCSPPVQSQIFATENGTSREGLNFQQVGNLIVTLPPSVVEQETIAREINTWTQNMDATMTKIRESIEKLREYRTALISAAVTGKINVREEMA